MYFLSLCVTVYCMQPCEAACLLAASRLVFPKQAAGLWLRFVCVCVHVRTCLIVTVHKECTINSPSLLCAFRPVYGILFMNVSVCRPVHLPVCSISTCLLKDILSFHLQFVFDCLCHSRSRVGLLPGWGLHLKGAKL